jgi:hypothetical protein
MRAIDIAPVSFMVATLMVSDADAASNRWCAYSPKRANLTIDPLLRGSYPEPFGTNHPSQTGGNA